MKIDINYQVLSCFSSTTTTASI